jgi:hypothetical protein
MGEVVSLAPAAMTSAQLKTACATGTDLPNVKVYNVAVPAGTVAARFALRNADVGTAGDDNDMGLLAPDGTWVYSGNDGSTEAVQVASPAAGNYKVCVVAYGGAAAMTHKLSSWVVTPADMTGRFTVAVPAKVVAGNNTTVGISWSGLTLGQRTLGAVQFKDAAGVVQATTVVRVEANGGLPVTEVPPSSSAKVSGTAN